MARVGYIRVSTVEQCTDRQLDGVSLDKIFSDKCSGKDTNREQLQACLEYLREGDILYVHTIDRLARNLVDLQSIVTGLNQRGVSVQFVKEGFFFPAGDDADPMSKLMLQLLGSFAEFERSMIRERQREGIAAAKKAGKHLGRSKSLNDDEVKALREKASQGASKQALAKEYGISRQSVYRYLQD